MGEHKRRLRILCALDDLPRGLLELTGDHSLDFLQTGASPVESVAGNRYHVVLFEGNLDMIAPIKNADPRTELVILGNDESEAVDAIKLGASAYLTKPFDANQFRMIIDGIFAHFEIRREVALLEEILHSKYVFAGRIVGKNPKMLDIFNLIERIAPYYHTVLISGETGTGKEVIAKALHSLSPGGRGPFVVCNCGGLTKDLIESELFGYKKGAFTGADRDKSGLFEAAGDGSIFLDEIGELPLSFQSHFLRVLQDGEFRPVGSTRSSGARCRVIAATNRDLAHEVKTGRFRKDLYYRLTPLTIDLPPLRERKDDIPLLCRLFIENIHKRTGKKIYGISRPAQNALMAYDWPGNIRELENVIEQSAIMSTETFIRLEDLPSRLQNPVRAELGDYMSLDQVIKGHIEATLVRCNGNRTRAAKFLNISRRSLLRKIDKYSLH